MRVFAFALAISFALAGAAQAAAPHRVASLKLCTDELLLMLASPDQILSVTYLVQQSEESPLWKDARRYRRNDGSLLSIAGLKPDLVVDMGGSGGRGTAQIARRLGIRVLDLPYPQSIGDLAASIRALSIALGRTTAGEEIVRRLHHLQATAPPATKDTIWLGGGGRSLAPAGLGAEWMALAGMKQRALPGDRVTREQLLVRPPALLLESNYRSDQYSAEQQWLAHPVVRRRGQWQRIATDGRRWTCMGPPMIAETLRLRALLAR
jgi:iron complex transport system substrate-binding protein